MAIVGPKQNVDSDGPTLLEVMKNSLTLQLLLPIVQDHLQLDHSIEAAEIKSLRISPFNHSLWEITFHKNLGQLSPQYSTQVMEEHSPSANQDGHTHTESLTGPNIHLRHDHCPSEDIYLNSIPLDENSPMAVGIVDKGSFSGENTHINLMRKLVRHPDSVEAVALPMVDSADEEATLFDLISALYNKSVVDSVQLINISQGFHAPQANPILAKALRSIDKPIVCSAGNQDVDDHALPHWPSQFHTTIPNVISVGYLEKKWGTYKPSDDSNQGEQVSLYLQRDNGMMSYVVLGWRLPGLLD